METKTRFDPIVVTIAFATFFVSLGLSDGAFGVGWVYIRDEFGRADTVLGVLLTVYTLGFLPAGFLSGPLAARFGSGPLILTGVIAVGLGMLGFATLPAWWMIIGASFIRGIGQGAIDAGMNAYIATNYNNRIMNWLHGWFGVGWTIGPLLMTTIVTQTTFSWRTGFLVVAALQLVMVAAYLLTLKRWVNHADVQADASAAPRPARFSVFETLRLPLVWVTVLFIFFYAGLEVTVGNWTFPLFKDSRGVPELLAGQLVSLYAGSFTLGRFLTGFIPPSVSRRTLLRASLSLVILGGIVFWWNPANWATYAALLLLGFAQAPVFATFVGATPGLIGAAHATNAIGFQLSAANLGATTLPALASLLVAAEAFTLEIIPPFILVVAVIVFVLNEVTAALSSRAPRRSDQPVTAR